MAEVRQTAKHNDPLAGWQQSTPSMQACFTISVKALQGRGWCRQEELLQRHPRQQSRKNRRTSSSPDAKLMVELRQEAKHNDPLALWQHTTEASMQGMLIHVNYGLTIERLMQTGGASATSEQPRSQSRKKQRKSSSPDALLMAEVRQAAKHNDPLAGLAAYDRSKQEGERQRALTHTHSLAY